MDPWQVVAVLATFIVTVGTAAARAFLRGDLVAGSTHRSEVAEWKGVADVERKARHLAERRADKSDTQVDRLTEAVHEVAATVKTSLSQREPPGRSGG